MKSAQPRSRRTGKLICRCKRGYASEFDGKCFTCRKGVTAYEARNNHPNFWQRPIK